LQTDAGRNLKTAGQSRPHALGFEQLAGIAAAPPKYLRTLPAAIARGFRPIRKQTPARSEKSFLH
jgi:hypothetical protein